MEICRTDRILLTELNIEDSNFIIKLVNSPDWLKFIGDRNVKNSKDSIEYIGQIRESYAEFGFGFYKMELIKSGVAIGICGIVQRPNLDIPDIGFALLPEYYGNGYAFEAAYKMLQYARDVLNLDTICAIATPDNIPSHKLLNKIGLRKKGSITWQKGEKLLLFEANLR